MTLWMAYYRIEPFGAWRDDWRMSRQALLTIAMNRTEDSPEEIDLSSFFFDSERETDADDDQMSFADFMAMETLAASYG